MGDIETYGIGDPRLMAHALSPLPAWLWSADGSRLLWANAAGVDTFRAPGTDPLAVLEFELDKPAPVQIARLAASLPNNGVWRLERLRGFGGGIGGALMCQCARIELSGGEPAILVVAGERTGADLPFETRLHHLLTADKTAAAFTTNGKLIDATPDAAARLAGASDLDSLGAQAPAQQANRDGHAEADLAIGRIALDRISAGDFSILLLTFMPAPVEAKPASTEPSPAIAAPIAKPAPSRLRFVWQIDAAQRFTIDSEEFVGLIGAQSAALTGRPWPEIAGALDPEGKIAAALASRNTWSGILLGWPVDGERVPVELSGLPVFDRDRQVQGYRGFGICRDSARLRELAELRRLAPAAPTPEPAAIVQPTEPAQPAIEAPPESATVVQFPTPERALSAKEASAFSELARELSDRLKHDKPILDDDFGDERPEPIATTDIETSTAARKLEAVSSETELPILERLPVGILIYRLNDLIYANRAFLDWTGYPNLQALRDAGGLDSLFIESAPGATTKSGNGGKTLIITTPAGKQMPVSGRLFSTQWNGDSALVLMLNTAAAPEHGKDSELNLRRIETESRELKAVLDTATDGIVLFGGTQRILSANSSAQALFGFEQADFNAMSLGDLFAPESKRAVLDYIERLARGGAAALMNQGMEVTGRVRRGGLVPLHMSIGQIDGGTKFCAVFRDITAWKRTEEDLINARRQAESASAAKSDFLAKISHEIRTPLNAIIGFAEVMIEERFGAIGNDRYRQYLRDIHTSGGHLISLLGELLDLSKIEAGKLDLTFTGVNLNDLTQQCVAIMQQQANRERVIIRGSLAANLPQIVADARSVRQIVLNLLSNSIKFTGAGGQVIVSTAVTDTQEVVLRVRDTGDGMSEQEIKAALEPFHQLATTSRWGSTGTGLGLPITKALAEANHATFKITSAVHDGTMVEIAFPATRVLA
jgi:PAS domain S-box-containing protein